ncbi:protein-disulfide reductase DsbD family protein [Parablastomonas sp. CN1-191]|uniref:protein-disulfide reductase DsbD family protein n=1 Tax=Parablastomonas sp. CN1-191 TaxID=3400908 RepID=UPI003BF882C8
MRGAAMRLMAMLAAVLVAALVPARAAETHIAAHLVVAHPAGPGENAMLAIAMTPAPGWHGYWSNPGDAGLGMTLDWALPTGAVAGLPRYPVPTTLIVGGLMNHVYARPYALLVPLSVPIDARGGQVLPLGVEAHWLACTDQVCVPEQARLTVKMTVGAGPDDPRLAEWTRALPAPLGADARYALTGDRLRLAIPFPASQALAAPHVFVAQTDLVDYAAPQFFSRRGDVLIAELARAKYPGPVPAGIDAVLRLDDGGGVAIRALTGAVPPPGAALTPARDPNYAWLVVAALLGGLILNIMPCVFPILSLKALSLARAVGDERTARREGIAYAAGVIFACTALGALLLALRTAGEEVGWAFQLQEPAVIVALALLATAITANLAGAFELALPGLGSGGGARGAFATGLLAAFVATPCTGPFMATAMGAALLLPLLPALLLFAALGLGLALPFLAIAFVPSLRRRLPRPGQWMETFRHVLAVPMGLTALALLWLAGQTGGRAFQFAVAVLALALVALLVAIGRRQRAGLSAGPLAGALGALLLMTVLVPRQVYAPPPPSSGEGLMPAKPFSEAELAAQRAAKAPVFVWMTADWCLTCKVNERVAIERTETRDAFGRAGIVVLKGDWTRRDPAITRYLEQHGAAGVPLYVFYPRGGGEPRVLPQVLTPATLRALAD